MKRKCHNLYETVGRAPHTPPTLAPTMSPMFVPVGDMLGLVLVGLIFEVPLHCAMRFNKIQTMLDKAKTYWLVDVGVGFPETPDGKATAVDHGLAPYGAKILAGTHAVSAREVDAKSAGVELVTVRQDASEAKNSGLVPSAKFIWIAARSPAGLGALVPLAFVALTAKRFWPGASATLNS